MFPQSLLILLVLCISINLINCQVSMKKCGGDTRGDGKCNHDPTHRVCARIGDPDTTFWGFTHQQSWCGTAYPWDDPTNIRCPQDNPTWCICKWATQRWIEGEKCENVEIDCEATDVCDLKTSYSDFKVKLDDAKNCIKSKCPTQWDACPDVTNSPSLSGIRRLL